jgi:hypothetical protein
MMNLEHFYPTMSPAYAVASLRRVLKYINVLEVFIADVFLS